MKVFALAVASMLAAAILPAGASPVCPDDKTVCGGRIFPEANNSVDFVQHDDNEYIAGILALEEAHPKFVRVSTLSELLANKNAVSVNGHEIYVVEITNFNVPERRKLPIVASLSVHGPERAGIEGGLRYMEDLATWADDEPDHKLRNGTQKDSTGIPVSEALKKTHIYFSNINPDGWESGDNANGNNYSRGNGNSVDLNREFPTKGWIDTSYTPLSEPESQAWDKFVRRVDPVATTDIHGEITSANNAFADIMYPAGEWNPREQAQEERLARHMKSNIERYFEIDNVELGTITGAGGMKPAEYATGYDVVGYDDSGFMGDYFTERIGALDMDVENFASHLFPGGNWFQPLEKAHIAAVRGQLETLIVEALTTKSVRVKLQLGKVGYMFDPARIKSKDGYGGPPPPPPYKPQSYNVSRMKYFKDLGKFSKKRFRKVGSGSVRRRGLRGLQTFVIANKAFPKDPKKRAIKRKKAIKKLTKFVKRGGNLVLTDKAIKLLPKFGVVDKAAIGLVKTNAGHLDIEDTSDPYVKGVHSTASQTYYEVPLGYPATDAAPHWTVERAAWEEAKGKIVAHVSNDGETNDDRVGLGRVRVGKGTIAIYGAVLPDATEKHDHFYGLANYGVTVAGGQILNNVIAYGRQKG